MKLKGRVLMAMSGGIDSSISALLLHEQGYEIIGVTMKTWDYSTSGGDSKETGCCSLDSINDARKLAVKMGFPHYVLDIRGEFEDSIVSNFVDEYMIGRTPNPCVLCNTFIKWEALLKRADDMGCKYIATGHYAKLLNENGRYYVSKGIDGSKDQAYVLWGVSQKNLKRTIFPLGNYHKTEIRDLAAKYGYEKLAKKRESYEICFIPDNDYRGFLNRRVEGLQEKVKDGDFVLTNGEVVGKHKGYPYYTIGQRRGLEIAMGVPMYVIGIEAKKNQVIIGTKDELKRSKMQVKKLNWQKYNSIKDGMEVEVQIRHHDKGTRAKLYNDGEDSLIVDFETFVNAITPGQSAVFFEDDDVVGGGFINKVL